MRDAPVGPTGGRLADLPLSDRRRLGAEKQRELDEGLTRAHLQTACDRQRYAAAQFARLLRAGPALGAALQRIRKGEG